MMSKHRINFEISRTQTRQIIRAKHGAITCLKCGSNDVELTPAVRWAGGRYQHAQHYQARKGCQACGYVEGLPAEEALELALFVTENKLYFTHNEICEAYEALRSDNSHYVDKSLGKIKRPF